MKEAQDHGDTSRAHLLGIIVELGCVRHVHDPESEGERLLCNSSNGKSLKGDAHRSNRHARTLGGTFAIGIVAVRSSVLVTLAANLGGVWALPTISAESFQYESDDYISEVAVINIKNDFEMSYSDPCS